MNTRFCLRPYDKVVSEKLEHAGILRPIARALSARGVKSSDDLLEDWTALCLLPRCRVRSKPPRFWLTPFKATSASQLLPTTTATAPQPARSPSEVLP